MELGGFCEGNDQAEWVAVGLVDTADVPIEGAGHVEIAKGAEGDGEEDWGMSDLEGVGALCEVLWCELGAEEGGDDVMEGVSGNIFGAAREDGGKGRIHMDIAELCIEEGGADGEVLDPWAEEVGVVGGEGIESGAEQLSRVV